MMAFAALYIEIRIVTATIFPEMFPNTVDIAAAATRSEVATPSLPSAAT
jgi:hypothetical protein